MSKAVTVTMTQYREHHNEVLALALREPVTVTYRGKPVLEMRPSPPERPKSKRSALTFFGCLPIQRPLTQKERDGAIAEGFLESWRRQQER